MGGTGTLAIKEAFDAAAKAHKGPGGSGHDGFGPIALIFGICLSFAIIEFLALLIGALFLSFLIHALTYGQTRTIAPTAKIKLNLGIMIVFWSSLLGLYYIVVEQFGWTHLIAAIISLPAAMGLSLLTRRALWLRYRDSLDLESQS